MGQKHCTSAFVSKMQVMPHEDAGFMADFAPEIAFLNTLPTLPVATGLRKIFHPAPFHIMMASCTAPNIQNGYEGPVVVLATSKGKHYVITREDEAGHLCLQMGDAAQMDKLLPAKEVICFGATPHVMSGASADVMRHIKKDILTNGLIDLPAKGQLRDAWDTAIVSYVSAKSQEARLAFREHGLN